MVAGCSCVLAAFLSHLFLRLGHPYHPRWGKKRQACLPCLPHVSPAFLSSASQAGLSAGCYLLYPVRVLCCRQDICCRTGNCWRRGLGLFQHPGLTLYYHHICTYVNLFGKGSCCHGHFANLFRCNRLNWDNSPLPSVFVHNWVLLVQCKL